VGTDNYKSYADFNKSWDSKKDLIEDCYNKLLSYMDTYFSSFGYFETLKIFFKKKRYV
jgi:hypothetical protein